MKKVALIAAIFGFGVGAAWMWHASTDASKAPSEADILSAAELRPDDAALAEIYERSCVACHSMPDAQAPLTGHGPSWAARYEARGAEGLLVSAMNGYGNMPAMGMCADCTDAQLHDLIVFMSDGVVQ